jgi:hypothetical protein
MKNQKNLSVFDLKLKIQFLLTKTGPDQLDRLLDRFFIQNSNIE